MPRESWAQAREILCVRLDSMGDVLMTEPAIRALKQAAPARRITLLTSPAGAEAGRLLPSVNAVIRHAASWMKANSAFANNSDKERRLLDQLRSRRFDAAVIFTVYSQSALPAALFCYLADIPLRLAHCRENPYQLLTDWVPEVEPAERIRHEVRRQLDLVTQVQSPSQDDFIRLWIPSEARVIAQSKLIQCGFNFDEPWLVVHPGASASSRRYPAELFAAAADLITRQLGHRVVFTGAVEERELIDRIRDGMRERSLSLAGELNLAQLAALLEQAPLLIANNTGPVHLAAGVGTPVVDLYALTNPQHRPWQVPHRVLSYDVPCKYCYKSVCPSQHHDCLRRIAPTEVVQAAAELLHRKELHQPQAALLS